jgi:pimeloyl-ACP methyl ester carboxylesterase
VELPVTYVTRAGSGPPVLLLHGIGGSADSFAFQVPGFAARREVIAWDAPGYARSADPAAPPGMPGYAAAAARLLIADRPAHVVGVSWGGVIATRLALDFPLLVRSLVLADSTRGSGRTAASRDNMLARPAELATAGPAAFAAARAPRLLSPSAPASLVARVSATMAGAIRLPGYRYAAASMAETDHSAELSRLALPVLVVAGSADTVAGVAESETIAAAIPHATLRVIEGAGHLANQERPEEFNALVTAFWQACDQAHVEVTP